MAVVYLARDQKLGRPVALKVLRPELAASLGGERFLREIEIAAKLTHPNILALYDCGEADGQLFYTMPFVEGESLRDRLTRERQLPIDDALQITREVADALGHAHSLGLVHRDVKPENILFQGGHALVADFGIARAVTEAGAATLTETGLAVGTPAYMSPEQATGTKAIDARTDIYSLGCVLYEMLSGDAPYTASTPQAVIAKKLSEPLPRVSVVREAVPAPIEAALAKAMARTPADRFTTAAQFVAALSVDVQVHERPAPGERRGSKKLLRSIVPVVVGAAVAIAATAAVLLWPRAPTLDPNLIAVAPFDAVGSGLERWRDDAATLLAGRLEGAGTLTTVPSSVVEEHWAGGGDRATALKLAGRVGAGLVLFATTVETTGDSVRLTATLLDAETGDTQDHPEVFGSRGSMDALVDSLATRVLVAFARDRMPRSIRWTSLGSSDPRAIKEFLTAELHFRGFRPDSARVHYERAIAEDHAFALAYRGLAYASEMAEGQGEDTWGLFPPWGASDALRLEAGGLNRGLARRESLLVVADSIWAGARGLDRAADVEVGSAADRLYLRLFGTLDTARLGFREDPEILFLLGHLVFAKGAGYGFGPERTVEALTGAVALDPEFLPAYFPLLFLDLHIRGREEGLRTMERFAALAGDSPMAEAARIAADIIASGGRGTADAKRRVDSLVAENSMITVKQEVLFKVYEYVLRARVYPPEWLLQATEGGWDPELAPGQFGQVRRVVALRDSLRPNRPHFWYPQFYPYVARVGAVPTETAARRIREYLDGPPFRIGFALRWWFEQRDTVSLEQAVAILRSRPDTLSGSYPTRRTRSVLDEAAAHLALLRGDSADAFALLMRWRRCTDGGWCSPADYTAAQLLAARGRRLEVDALSGWGAFGSYDGALTQVLQALLRGRINERSRPELAAESYRFVLDLWADGDPEVQPWVEEARAGLARLSSEPT